MIEQFHQLNQGEFRIITIHVVHLPPECLTERVTREVLNLQAVFLLSFPQDYVDPLDREDCTFLTDQYWCSGSDWLNMRVALRDMLLEL